MPLSVSISAICCLFVSFSTICALIPCWGFLIVCFISFLQAFEENSPFAAYKTALLESSKIIGAEFRSLHLRLLFYQLAKLDGIRLKIEGVLILCIVVVLAKTCFEKFAPKVRIKVNNFLPVKTFVRHISQTIRCIGKKNWPEIHLMYI